MSRALNREAAKASQSTPSGVVTDLHYTQPEVARAERIYSDEVSEVWIGDSLNPETRSIVLGERKPNALIFDGPFSAKTHEGHAGGKLTADRAAGYGKSHSPKRQREAAYSRRKAAMGESGRRDIEYQFWTMSEVERFSEIWVPSIDGWCVSITDDVLSPIWSGEFRAYDRLTFAPLPLIETGSRVRMMGDGPSGWTCWCVVASPEVDPVEFGPEICTHHCVVARPKNLKFAHWGTTPGCYIVPGERKFNSHGGSTRIVGGKPLLAMTQIVRDYSRPGDLVVDPCCGGGTTGIAAKMLGRRFIGIDSKREHAELTARVLSETRCQQRLFEERREAEQIQLLESP